MRLCLLSLGPPVLVSFIFNPDVCRAQWAKDFDCPAGTVYRDLRPNAGREEFCERLLPGSLRVKDGHFKFWFSEGNPGDEGTYTDGRRVGPWKECSRFGKCTHVVYELMFPYEKGRPGFRREVPVSFQDGKYVFDFASCWSTWVSKDGVEELNLNITSSRYRCGIAYLPQHVIEHGGDGDYLCRIPFSVGKRELESLDLLHELPRLGLPQFCKTIGRTGEAFMLLENFEDVVTTVDVEKATISHDNAGHETLTFRLNQYATDLATEVAAKEGPLTARVCTKYDQQAETSLDASGRTLFTYRLSDRRAEANEQKKCLANLLDSPSGSSK